MPPAHLRGPQVFLDRLSGCTGKVGYVSRKDALHAADERGGVKLTTYVCPHCGHWHLTSRGKLFTVKPNG